MSLDLVEKQMHDYVAECADADVLHYYGTLQGGKRMRAKLILYIADGCEDAIALAAIIEMIHAASLLHDDVIDEAMTRRGVASVNATQGSKVAVMLGDILYSKAFEKLTAFNSDIAKSVAGAVSKLSLGELQDVNMAERFSADKAAYMQMLYLKTASLIEASAYSAALLSGKSVEAALPYAQYGRALGLAFQLVDDILDLTADEQTLGKPAMNDFVEGKSTLPYIFLYDALDDRGKERLVALHKQPLTSEESRWINEQMQQCQSIEKAKKHAKTISDSAIMSVDDDYLHGVIMNQLERHY